jgi:hypothetical protein
MTSDRFYDIFKVAGKLIALSDEGQDYSANLKSYLTATEQQVVATASGSPDPYSELTGFTVPLVNSMRNIVQSLDRIELTVKAGLDNYLRTVSTELDLTPSAPVATIATALKSAMADAEQTVAPSGSFFDYFADEYSVNLPVPSGAADETIPDALITVTLL